MKLLRIRSLVLGFTWLAAAFHGMALLAVGKLWGTLTLGDYRMSAKLSQMSEVDRAAVTQQFKTIPWDLHLHLEIAQIAAVLGTHLGLFLVLSKLVAQSPGFDSIERCRTLLKKLTLLFSLLFALDLVGRFLRDGTEKPVLHPVFDAVLPLFSGPSVLLLAMLTWLFSRLANRTETLQKETELTI